jgi:glucose-1-phosphate cytidylyltransferase
MKAVILAGGLGTRLREETEFRPKPMVEIGGYPILWHLLKLLGKNSFNEFLICAGYKGNQIKEYFLNYSLLSDSVEVNIGGDGSIRRLNKENLENWKVTILDTGLSTNTGGRVLYARNLIGNSRFLCTYGDGLANINLDELIKFHTSHGKLATVTLVRPQSRFGSAILGEHNEVLEFVEKPQMDSWVSGGFFIFEPGVFDYLTPDSVLETLPMQNLARDGQLMAFKHSGFWQPMDTYRESQLLNEIWESGNVPWKNW